LVNPFDTALIATAGAFSTMFGETVVYKPLGGDERSIQAIVTRPGLGPVGGGEDGDTELTTINVENDATTGISTAEVDTGGDKVSLPTRIGNAAEDRPIGPIISQDAGRVTYEVY